VLDNAKNAYGVFMKGGPHVIWGRGLACPDTVVQALLYEGTPPTATEQICEQDPIGDYTPLTLTDPAQMSDAFVVARAFDTELMNYPPLMNWDGDHPTAFGCPLGGTLTAAVTESGTDFTFDACRFWPDLALSGTGVEIKFGDPDDSLTLSLTATGSQTGSITYQHRLTDKTRSITGLWNGKPAQVPRLP
jgi:hypothetical protein